MLLGVNLTVQSNEKNKLGSCESSTFHKEFLLLNV